LLDQLGDELRFVLITSEAILKPLTEGAGASATELSGLKVSVAASAHTKCVRCWHHRADVGAHAAHPELCGRCISNIEGPGEARRFA
jgi:isoleucyl-tRNA synthetase